MNDTRRFIWKIALPITLLLSLGVASLFLVNHRKDAAHAILFFALIFGSLPLAYQILASFARRHFGIDVIAITAIIASAMLQEYLVGIIILLMLATGESLEYIAFQRARKEITELLAKAPSKAYKKDGETLINVPIESIQPEDILIVRPGEIIPVDGIIIHGETTIDESTLTGESMPLFKQAPMRIMSGSVNQSGVIEIKASATSQNSQYEHIVRLVKEAQSNEAPFVRMADTYSARFTLITLCFAFLAWLVSGDPLRVLAVLVVATPCPLILATPIAFASGISRAAKRGIMIKNGGALEHLGNARVFVFDKTGTLTLGTPQVQSIDAYSMAKKDTLRIAASIEQFSAHIIAHALTEHAKKQGVSLSLPEHFEEVIGKGVSGSIDGVLYFFGSPSFLEAKGVPIENDLILKHETSKNLGIMITYLATQEKIIGDIHFADIIRSEVKYLFHSLTQSGIEKIVMLTGDKETVAKHIAERTGITEYRSGCLPEDKIKEIRALKGKFSPIIMVGDGINDAPALIEADMGIALGTRGSSAASEAGDVVITVNTLERVVEAFHIGKKVLTVAHQGIFIGIGLSITLMIFASLGYIPPALGAILQEVIDVIAIVNALRVHTDTQLLAHIPLPHIATKTAHTH
ncbi:MAG: heavy metal translocating P-type ATPase [Candidatus Moranbacteria bacterium]|nr:heavy metal translocating P-type ATPase [Candidatus Moranbacteria bacterium]